MTNRDPKMILTVRWMAAAATGLLVGLIPLFDDHPPARVLAVGLVLAAVPFGLSRPKAPWLYAVVVAWPTVTLRFSQAGWHAIFLLIYSLVGVYAGDWLAQWWQEAHPRVYPGAPRTPGVDAGSSQVAADGSAAAPDGLPPQMPDRY
jgi:hypothetical protein